MKKRTLLLAIATLTLQAGSFTITDEVRVTSSTPEYKTITKKVPYQECWDEEIPVRRYGSNYNNSNSPFGTIIGGVAGGVLGNQVGKGRGKDLATIGGALIGGIVGHNLSGREHHRSSSTTYETRQRCTTRYTQTQEEKLIGYRNIGHYKGNRITKISNRRLRYIPVTIKVNY